MPAMTRDPRYLGMALTLRREECRKGKGRVSRDTGIQRSHLSAYEQGETVPRPETLARLAVALDTTAERLEATADALAATPGLLEPAGPSALESALLPPLAPAASPHRTADALWQRLLPYTAAQRRAIVLETPDFHRPDLSERLLRESRETALGEAAGRHLADLAGLVESLAPRSAGGGAAPAAPCYDFELFCDPR